MSDSENKLKHNPFAKLDKGLRPKASSTRPPSRSSGKQSSPPESETAKVEKEEAVFLEAMQGVKPIDRSKLPRKKNPGGKSPRAPVARPPDDTVDHLYKLVETGEGFIVSDTPEYMEGTGRDIPPEFAERLHRGDFSIQAHIDLHGMGVAQAREAFEKFLNEALASGKKAVLVIHGRGLSSPGEPVLKNKVREWLTRTSWRKRVIAFASAQSYDGGAGATYILLRRRPVRGKSRKNPSVG